MYLPGLGDYLMLNRVIVFEHDQRIGCEPTPGDARTAQCAGLQVRASPGYSWGFELHPRADTTVVTEAFDCTQAAQGIRDNVQDGQRWLPAMHQALERLAALVEST